MVRVGVIGLGGIGNLHARCYDADPLCELVAVCDMDLARAEAAGERFGVQTFESTLAMFAAVEMDAVSVCTAGRENGGDHYTPVMGALAAGKHVLCEKPLSNDVALAREMVQAADQAGLCLGTNLNHRFVPFAWRAKEWIGAGDDGPVGKLLFANMALRIENPNETSPLFHFRALHPHSLDVLRFFMGDARAVHCFANRAPGRVNWSNLSLNIEFENGAIGHLSGSYDAGGLVERCEVAGTSGRFVIDGVYESLHYFPRKDGEREDYVNPPEGAEGHVSGFDATFTNRIHRWVQDLADGVPPSEVEASGRAGLHVQEVIEAAIKSFQTRSVVSV